MPGTGDIIVNKINKVTGILEKNTITRNNKYIEYYEKILLPFPPFLCLIQWFSKWGPQTSSCSLTGEFVGNAYSQAHSCSADSDSPEINVSTSLSKPRCVLKVEKLYFSSVKNKPMLAECGSKKHIILELRKCSGDFPGGPVVKTALPLWGVQFQSLLGDLRFHILCSAAKTKPTKLNKPQSTSFTGNCAGECGLEVRAG